MSKGHIPTTSDFGPDHCDCHGVSVCENCSRKMAERELYIRPFESVLPKGNTMSEHELEEPKKGITVTDVSGVGQYRNEPDGVVACETDCCTRVLGTGIERSSLPVVDVVDIMSIKLKVSQDFTFSPSRSAYYYVYRCPFCPEFIKLDEDEDGLELVGKACSHYDAFTKSAPHEDPRYVIVEFSKEVKEKK